MASGPFSRTLDPMRVIDDPATVLVTYAITIGVASRSWGGTITAQPASDSSVDRGAGEVACGACGAP